MTMKILGVDPGKSTGYALINLQGKEITVTPVFGVDKNMSLDSIKKLLEEGVDHVVIEDFQLRPDKARKGHFDYNNMPASKQIGKLELLCELTETQFSMQPSSVKPPAYGFAGLKYTPGLKGQHWKDALAHACYYAVKSLGALPVKTAKKK